MGRRRTVRQDLVQSGRLGRFSGPVLLVAAKNDSIWPSARMADRVAQRLRRINFKHPVEH